MRQREVYGNSLFIQIMWVLTCSERGKDGGQDFIPLFHGDPLSSNFTKHSIRLEGMVQKKNGKN
ncbi:unnamed protein product [Gulo gulo]|uniref:Uncharacterized protein n=1 Tax=Gulo gulo TaxID=48420 RepID=A0A9X9Q274_GULGU|nr:unnamed protein product [Gulo gulo]